MLWVVHVQSGLCLVHYRVHPFIHRFIKIIQFQVRNNVLAHTFAIALFRSACALVHRLKHGEPRVYNHTRTEGMVDQRSTNRNAQPQPQLRNHRVCDETSRSDVKQYPHKVQSISRIVSVHSRARSNAHTDWLLI